MNRIPHTWEITTLGIVARIRNGYAFKSTEFTSTGVPLVRQSNLSGDTVDLSKCAHLPASYLQEFNRFSLKKGDILIGMSGSVGKLCIFNQDIVALQNQRTGKIELVSQYECSERYVWHFLKTIEDQLLEKSKGVAVANVSAEDIQSVPFALAPLAEQKRIADKLDTILTRVDAVNTRLARVAPLLKRFRQSVLAAATSGRLTEDWRNGEPTDWTAMRADVACDKVQSGGTPKAGFADAGVPFLKVYNIVDQRIDFDYKPQFVTNEVQGSELRKSQVQPDDVLMNIVGPPLGKVAIVPSDHPAWNINQAITLFRPSDRVSARWIYIVLCEGAPIREILNSTKGSVGQVNISLSQCRAFEFPVPSSDEQVEIVRRVDTLFAFADRLEARLQVAQTATDRLTPSLLAKAFRGELVPQDPNDEPASELLKRLAAAPATLTRKRRSKTTS